MSCQANDSVVAVLEKVASLDDKEEVANLVEKAEGRKIFLQIIARYMPHLLPASNSKFDLLHCAKVYKS